MIYKISQFPNQIIGIDGDKTMFIPMNEANTDYQEYLEWLAEGNEPLPPDDSE